MVAPDRETRRACTTAAARSGSPCRAEPPSPRRPGPSAAARDPASTCTSGRDRTRLPGSPRGTARTDPSALRQPSIAAVTRNLAARSSTGTVRRAPPGPSADWAKWAAPCDFSEPLAREHIPRGSIVPESSRMFHQFPRLRAHALPFRRPPAPLIRQILPASFRTLPWLSSGVRTEMACASGERSGAPTGC
jgi:hypothetical protein